MKNWYIVQSHSSFENKVAQLIKEEADKAKIADKFEEIVVPTHDVTEVKRGKRVQRKKKYFPGYVLIKSEMDNSIYHMIKGIKRVSGFLGSKGIPVPVSDKEIEKILGQIKDGVAQSKSTIDYSVGEKVQVIDGPFASFSGMIEDIDEDRFFELEEQVKSAQLNLNSERSEFEKIKYSQQQQAQLLTVESNNAKSALNELNQLTNNQKDQIKSLENQVDELKNTLNRGSQQYSQLEVEKNNYYTLRFFDLHIIIINVANVGPVECQSLLQKTKPPDHSGSRVHH